MPPRAPRSDKGKPRAPRGAYENPPKGLRPFADLRYINRHQLAEATGYVYDTLRRLESQGRGPAPEPDVRDGAGRVIFDTHREDVKQFVAHAVAAYKARNAKRLKGD